MPAQAMADAERSMRLPGIGSYRCRFYDGVAHAWVTREDLVRAVTLHRGLTVQVERKGCWVLDLRQEVYGIIQAHVQQAETYVGAGHPLCARGYKVI